MEEKLRCDIKDNYKWDLEKIYKNEEEIEKDIAYVKEECNNLLKYKGILCNDSNTLYDAITTYYKISRTLDKLVVYSNMKYHEDMALSRSKITVSKIDKLNDDIASKLSFFTPELLKQDKKIIDKYIEKNDKLKEYKFVLDDVFHEKPYILSAEKESMMARLGEVFNNPTDIYETLDAVDVKFKDFTVDGKTYPLNQSNYTVYLKDYNREIREKAFHNFYETYNDYKNTFASVLYGNIKTNFFISNERGYKSPLHMYLYQENIDEAIYDRLIKKVNERIDISYKYIKLRKKVLNLDELHMYDIYVPLVYHDKKYTFESAIEIVKKALAPLGDNYIKDLTEIINSNCIDVYHNRNKQTGAYSWGSYDTLPYVLLNFEGTFNDVSTIAHELGHSMHSYYSKKNNPYQTSSYTIFLAEIASTVNEILLNKYMYNNSTTKEEKLYYLNNLLEMLRTTLIRQTMFAEFEKTLYDKEQNGTILTEEEISNTYLELNKKYYGNDIISDDEIRLEWARISHFYKGFYVYKYATGISIACKIVSDILENKEGALENYMKLLKSGGSNYSLELLKLANVDIANDDTIDKALDLFDETIEEFKNIF